MTSNNISQRDSVHRAESQASPTGLSTDSLTVLLLGPYDSAGTTVLPVYCCLVLLNSKEGRSMEPRQLRLPGFTRLWASRSSLRGAAGDAAIHGRWIASLRSQ